MSEPLIVELSPAAEELLARRSEKTRRAPDKEAAIVLEQALEAWVLETSVQDAFRRRLVTTAR